MHRRDEVVREVLRGWKSGAQSSRRKSQRSRPTLTKTLSDVPRRLTDFNTDRIIDRGKKRLAATHKPTI